MQGGMHILVATMTLKDTVDISSCKRSCQDKSVLIILNTALQTPSNLSGFTAYTFKPQSSHSSVAQHQFTHRLYAAHVLATSLGKLYIANGFWKKKPLIAREWSDRRSRSFNVQWRFIQNTSVVWLAIISKCRLNQKAIKKWMGWCHSHGNCASCDQFSLFGSNQDVCTRLTFKIVTEMLGAENTRKKIHTSDKKWKTSKGYRAQLQQNLLPVHTDN